MNKTTILYSSLILIGTFISAISQVMLKKAAVKKYASKLKEYLNPLVFLPMLCLLVPHSYQS